MKSEVVETKDNVFIAKIPQLKWGENTDNSFIRSAQLSLNAFGEKGKPLDDDVLFKNSLKIAVQLAKTDEFKEYKSGYSAFKKWIEELKKYAVSIKTKMFAEYEVNLTIFNYLLDSRKAAVGYLTSMNNRMKKAYLIIDNYRKEVELLIETQKNILPSYNSEPKSWTEDIINKQIDVLTQISRMEKETIDLFEEELKN